MKRLSYFVSGFLLIQCATASYELFSEQKPKDEVDEYIKGIEEPENGELEHSECKGKIPQELQTKIEILEMKKQRAEQLVKSMKRSFWNTKNELMAEKAQLEVKLSESEIEKIKLQAQLMQFDTDYGLQKKLLEVRARAAEKKSKREAELNEEFMKYVDKEREIWTGVASKFIQYLRESEIRNGSNDLIIENCESNIELLANRTMKAIKTCSHKASKVAFLKAELRQMSTLRSKEKEVLERTLLKLEAERNKMLDAVNDAYLKLQNAQRSNEYCANQLVKSRSESRLKGFISHEDLIKIVQLAKCGKELQLPKPIIPQLLHRDPVTINAFNMLDDSETQCEKQERLIHDLAEGLMRQERMLKMLRRRCVT